MANLYEQIGKKIRELRGEMSQETLARKLKIAPNTLSRWETGTYKPTPEDLDTLARLFNVPITVFFPTEQAKNERLAALTSATGGLSDSDLDEVVRYAEFRKTRRLLEGSKRKKR